MLKILKTFRRPSQNNCLDIVNTVTTQLAQDYTRTSPKSPNVRDLQRTFKKLSGDQY